MNSTTGVIFIPCRGGGTATTYYTDFHYVDEDLTAIVNYGGYWGYENYPGITDRDLVDTPTTIWNSVASRLIYLS